ncbi:MAG: hypothetical protein QM702_11135 [Rubrivivax sp.]
MAIGAEQGAEVAAAFDGMPTLTVCLDRRQEHKFPGRVFACRHIIKTAQIRQYAEAGLLHPRSVAFTWGMQLDPAQWGKLLVMKPLDPKVTSRGIVRSDFRSRCCRASKPENFAAGHPIHTTPMLLQAFIDTGPRPSHFRVLTLFGEPLYAVEHVMDDERPPLDAAPEVLLAANIATNGGERNRRLIDDEEILAFARRMSRALPAIPLQGIDVMREHGTGRLFAIENNTGGNTWHFSSNMGKELRDQLGRDALVGQFDAFATAARVLVDATRTYAR